FIQTNAVMYRTLKYKELPNNIMPSDIYMHLYHAKFGKIGFINRVMSTYRRHVGGIWWSTQGAEDERWKKYALQHLALFIELHKLFGNKEEYRNIIENSIDSMFKKIINLDSKDGEDRLQKVIHDYPVFTVEFIARQQEEKTKDISKKDQDITYLQGVVDGFKQLAVDLENKIALKDQEISMIKSSRIWKTKNKLAKAMGRKKI
ncbi:MAG TPA: hypothetical protein VII94_03235, partial [Candidatus Saccharimonadales bacterium]